MQQPLNMHHIHSNLFSLPFSKLHALYNYVWKTTLLIRIQMNKSLQQSYFDIARHRLFKLVDIMKDDIDKRSIRKLSLTNKTIDAITLCNILHHKSVKSKIPPYFKDQSLPIISYNYTTHIATKICNGMVHDLNIDDFKFKSPDCFCTNSTFIYIPTCNVITGYQPHISTLILPKSSMKLILSKCLRF